ncbi:MAG: hypothetical protein V4671_15895 [Armatimonadota bacterium]
MASIDSNALTLGDHAQLSQNPIQKEIVKAIYETNNVVKDLPLSKSAAFKSNSPRLEGDGLPEVNWGRVNAAPVTTKATFKQHEEAASIVRSRIRLDKRVLNQKDWITDPIKAQVMAWTEAWAYDATDKYFNNDPSAVDGNPDAWTGLKARLDDPIKFGVVPELKIDAGGINLKQNMTAADANNFMEVIDQMLSYLGATDGNGCVFYCNDLVMRRWARAIRLLGAGAGFNTQKDNFDRMVEMYRNAKVRDCGRKRDQVSRVISNTEAADGTDPGNGDRSSIYVVRYGEGRMAGWHDGDLEPEYTGKLDDGVTHQWLVDYLIGLNPQHNRCFARSYNLEVS